ncbi:MAG: DUF3822 family protein [Saprospiraceae bacterium]
MAKIIYDIFDEKLLSNSSYQYRLSMLLSDVACSYLIYDNQQSLAYKSYALEAHNRDLFSLKDELELLLSTDKMLNLSFSEISIRHLTSAFTQVPVALFEAENPYIYLNIVCPAPASELLKTERCLDEIMNIYLLKIDLHQYIQHLWPHANITNLFSELVNKCYFHAKKIDGDTLFVNFHQNQMQIIAFRQAKLHLVNNFTFQTADDVTYYTLLVINQLGFDPETAVLMLSGHISNNSELYNSIYRYVRNVDFIETTSNSAFQKDTVFGAYPLHTFYDIN